MKAIAVGLLFASALSMPAAPESLKVEVRAASVTSQDQTAVFTGGAVAAIGDMRVHAEKIVYDRSSGLLTCVGEAKIEMPDRVITGTDVTIDTKEKEIAIRATTLRIEK